MEPFSAVPATITAHGLDNTVLRELERVRVGVFTLDPEQAQVGLALHHVRGGWPGARTVASAMVDITVSIDRKTATQLAHASQP